MYQPTAKDIVASFALLFFLLAGTLGIIALLVFYCPPVLYLAALSSMFVAFAILSSYDFQK
jgi:hypothetical protein